MAKHEGDVGSNLECPFEHAHSAEGGTACMAMNPDASDSDLWTIFCHHDSCQGLHKLEFVRQMLEDGWFTEEDLTAEEYNLPPADDEIEDEIRVEIAAAEAAAEAGARAERRPRMSDSTLPCHPHKIMTCCDIAV